MSLSKRMFFICNSTLPPRRASAIQTLLTVSTMSEIKSDQTYVIYPQNGVRLDEIPEGVATRLKSIKNLYYLKSWHSKFLYDNFRTFWSIYCGIGFAISAFRFHRNFLPKRNFDIIYTRCWISIIVFYLFKLLLRLNYVLVFECHKVTRTSQLASRCANVTFCSNPLISMRLNKVSNKRRIVYAGNFATIPISNSVANKDEYICKSFSRSKTHIGYSGSSQSWKGLDILIKSLKYLPAHFMIHLFGVSEEELSVLLKKFNIQELGNRVRAYGFVENADLFHYLRCCDVLVCTSKPHTKDGLYTSPLKLFDYVYCDKPIVCSNIESVIALKISGVVLYDYNCQLDLSNKIKYAISNKKYLVNELSVNKSRFNVYSYCQNLIRSLGVASEDTVDNPSVWRGTR